MSIYDTTQYLINVFSAMTPTPNVVYDIPQEGFSVAECPVILVTLAPQSSHTWRLEASNYARHEYLLTVYVFTGMRNTGVSHVYEQILDWPLGLATALFKDMTLACNVTFIGAGNGQLFDYRYGEIVWGESRLWGLVINLPVTEKIPLQTGQYAPVIPTPPPTP
jgi:hypothetical protein